LSASHQNRSSSQLIDSSHFCQVIDSSHGIISQKRKFAPIMIIPKAQKAHFFACRRTGFVNQVFGDFVKMTLTCVPSPWL